MDQQPILTSASYNTPLWQRGAATPTTYAGAGPSSAGGCMASPAVDDEQPVGYEAHPQIQVGKPEVSWR